MPLQPGQQTALIGVIEARRYQAIAYRMLGQTHAAREMIESAAALAASRGLRQQNLTARLYRTAATVGDADDGDSGDMRLAETDFAIAQPGSRPLAQTYLLRAGEAMRSGAVADAVGHCRKAKALLDQLHAGSSAELVAPCLAAYAAQARADAPDAQALLADMFEMSQLVQGSVTSQQIALAAARLSAGAGHQAVGDAIRRQQDAALALAAVEQQRDAADQGSAAGKPDAAGLARRLADAQAALADADTALQTAAPQLRPAGAAGGLRA